MSTSKPLLMTMHNAYWQAAGCIPPPPCSAPECYAAMIRVIANWLVPEEPIVVSGGRSYEEALLASERERLRNLLFDEANRAESGE